MPLDFMLQIALEWETRENPSGTPLAIRPFIKEFLHYFFFIHWELKHWWSAAMITEDLHSKGWKKKTHKKNPTYFPQLSFIITAMEGDENICKENSTEDRGWVFIHKELCQGHTVTHHTSTAGKKNAFYSNQVGKLLGTSFPVILPSFLKAFLFESNEVHSKQKKLGCHRCFYRPGVFMSHITRKGRSWSSQKQQKHPNLPSYRAEFYSMAPKTLFLLDWGTTKSLQLTRM